MDYGVKVEDKVGDGWGSEGVDAWLRILITVRKGLKRRVHCGKDV